MKVLTGISVFGRLSEALHGVARTLARQSLLFYLTAAVLVVSLTFGGGTRGGFLSDVVVQFAAIPLLLVGLFKLIDYPITPKIRSALYFCLAIVALPLIQLIPLPPSLWTLLPGHAVSAAAFEAMGQEPPWMPISVAPEATWIAWLSLIAPVSIFIATLMLSYRDRRWLTVAIIAVGVISVFIGLVQVAQGPESSLRFFQFVNRTEAVGFFANRNHFAALIYVTILFAGAWIANYASKIETPSSLAEINVAPILAMTAGFTLLVLLMAGEIMARSRAALGLTIVGLSALLALGLCAQRDRGDWSLTGFSFKFPPDRSWLRALSSFTPIKLVGAAIVLTLIFSLQFGLYRFGERFEQDPAQDARLVYVPNTVSAALAYLPFGAGMGSFVSVYPLFEKPEDTEVDTYANRAHNDVVEVWLETGLPGLVLMILFLIWYGRRTVEIWRWPPPPGVRELDWSIVRAASVAIALVMIHSIFDYPLRTGAFLGLMAFVCALLVEPGLREAPASPAPQARPDRTAPRLKAALPAKPAVPQLPAVTSGPGPKPGGERWGEDISWPKEWTTPSDGGNEPKPPTGSPAKKPPE